MEYPSSLNAHKKVFLPMFSQHLVFSFSFSSNFKDEPCEEEKNSRQNEICHVHVLCQGG